MLLDVQTDANALLDNRTLLRHLAAVRLDNPTFPLLRGGRRELQRNAKIKHYIDGSSTLLVCTNAVFMPAGYDRIKDAKLLPEIDWYNVKMTEDAEEIFKAIVYSDHDEEDHAYRAIRRARAAVRDLARSNNWAYFVTLTLSPEKMDRYDIVAATKTLNRWLDNRVRRDGLKYILIAEAHKDGAIHYHGLFNDVLEAHESGVLSPPNGGKPRRPRTDSERLRMLSSGWHEIFNLPDWKHGYTTAIELYGERNKAIAYVCKYIGKSGSKLGGRYYYSGGDLLRPRIELLDLSYELIADMPGAYGFEIPETGNSFVLIELLAPSHPLHG
jgi:hypothetical protein